MGIQELGLTSLKETIRLARVEEAKIEARGRRFKLTSNRFVAPSSSPSNLSPMNRSINILQTPITINSPINTKLLAQANESVRNLPKGLTREQINEEERTVLCLR